MWIYLALLCLPVAWAFARKLGPRYDKAAAIAIGIALTLFIGLRREVGGDWDAYLIMFGRAHHYDPIRALALDDPAYVMLARLVAGLGLGPGVVNLSLAALFAGALMLFCARRPSPPIALAVSIPVLVVIGAMGFTRQAAAAALIMAALALWRPTRPWRSIALFVAAPLFHWSALVALPLLPVLYLRRPQSPWGPILCGLALGAAVTILLMANDHLSGRITAASVSGGALLRMAPSIAAMLFHVAMYKRLGLGAEDNAAMAYWCGLTAFAAALLPSFPTAADRFNLYTVIFQMTVAANMVLLARNAGARSLIGAVVAVPFVLLFLGWLVLSPYRVCWMPYRSYIGEPAALLLSRMGQPSMSKACNQVQRKFIGVKIEPAPGRR